MYATLQNSAHSTSDLAARLTDLAFEVLPWEARRGDSIETELTLWHTLRTELNREPRDQHFASGLDQSAPLEGELRQIVYRAVRSVASE